MKKFFAVLLASTLSLSLMACGGGGGGAATTPTPAPTPAAADAPAETNGSEAAPPPVEPSDLTAIDWGEGAPVSLRVWGSQEDQVMLGEMVDAFMETYSATDWDISLSVVSEADARARFLEDPAAAADVFAFPNDQLRDLVAAGALYDVTGIFKDTILAESGAGAVGSATLDGTLWAFPMTADNGYFLFYDSSVIDSTQVQSLDGILEAAEAAGKRVFMDVSNGWYIASFFLGAGGTLGIDADGNQYTDFNNATGLAVAETIQAFTSHPAFMTGDDAVLTGGFDDGTIAAGVSGIWNADAISNSLGENYAATKLPTMTLNGEQVQMSSFGGYKLLGINSGTAHPDAAKLLAQWLTNEENQLKRFHDRQMGPSNTAAASNPAVLENVALAALALQSVYAVSQNDVLGSYWEPAEAFGLAMETGDTSMTLQEMLDAMVAQITS